VSDEDGRGGIAPAPSRRRWLAAMCLALAVALAAAAGAAVALAGRGAGTQGGPAIAIGVGDIVKVAGAPIGCAARLQDSVRALDCRRIGPLRGTYGTILTRRRLLVVRFLDKTSATVVFSARHGQPRARTCG
jgi:hypothetical protein